METEETITDEIIELNKNILGVMFSRAKRHHEEQFTELNKGKNSMFRLFFQIISALLEAKRTGSNPYAAIERYNPIGSINAKDDRC